LDSSDGLLVTRIDKQFEDLSLYEQGGVTYIKIALDEMFTISNTVVTTLQGFLENFAKDGIAKVPNKDVCIATEQIVAVAERLAKVSALPCECTVQILEGLTKCSVTVFKCLRQLHTFTSLHDSSCLGGINKLCKEANDIFNALNVPKEWNITQKHRIDTCFNCGDPNHGAPKCPKPIDQARIDQATLEFSQGGGLRGGRGSQDSQFGHGSGYKCCEGNITYICGKWKSNAIKATNAVTTLSGIG
jgi:hypothetical protein